MNSKDEGLATMQLPMTSGAQCYEVFIGVLTGLAPRFDMMDL